MFFESISTRMECGMGASPGFGDAFLGAEVRSGFKLIELFTVIFAGRTAETTIYEDWQCAPLFIVQN